MRFSSRFNLLIIAIFILILLGTLLNLWIVNNKAKVLTSDIEKDLKIIAQSNVELKSEPFKKLVNDYTYWDEMYNYVFNPSKEWFSENIIELKRTLEADDVFILQTNGTLINKTGIKNIDFYGIENIENFLKIVFRERMFHTYEVTKEGTFVEVFSATIHKTLDVERVNAPNGYLILVKVWDKKYISSIAQATGCKLYLSINDSNKSFVKNEDEINYKLALTNYQNQTSGFLYFTKEVEAINLLNDFNYSYIIVSFSSFILVILTLLYTYRKWLNNPVKNLKKYIETEDSYYLEQLFKTGNEFKEIAQIVNAYIIQKNDLIHERIKAAESDKLKSSFLSNISHELRTPMNGIIGFSTLLQKKNITMEQIQKYASFIRSSSNGLMEILNDIIEIARIEAGEVHIVNAPFSLNNLMEYIYVLYKEKAEKSKLTFEYVPPKDGYEYIVNADKLRILQVLTKLLNNSFKFTLKGTICYGAIVNKGNVTFYVRDTGVGISDKDNEIIFEPFRQADTGLNRKFSGTGVGLSIAKSITELMKGSIWFESEKCVGTTFYISFPLVAEKSGKNNENQLVSKSYPTVLQ